MSFRGKLWVLVVSGVIAVYAVTGGLPFVGGLLTTSAQEPINDASAQLRIVESVLQHIRDDYVDEPNMDKVRIGALRGLAAGLDPYSSFLTAQQVKSYEANKTATNRVGIGAELSQLQRYVYVISATKGSPAEKAGLKAGDVITEIDGAPVRGGLGLFNTVKEKNGADFTLKIVRDRKTQVISVTPQKGFE